MTSLLLRGKSAAPHGPQAVLQTRRGFIATGLSLPFATAAAAQPAGPPAFSGPSSQFVEIDPPEDVGHIVLTRLDGTRAPLSSYRGKAALLNFWASWCPPCRRELPLLQALQRDSRDEPFVVLPVSLDKRPATVDAYLKRLRLGGLTTFIDAPGEVASGPKSSSPTPFPLYGMPMTYLLDRETRSVGYLVGEADWNGAEGRALLRFHGMSRPG